MLTVLETLRAELINPRVVNGKLQPSFVSTKPLRVYAIAHSLGQAFAQIMVMAAEETLRFDLHAAESSSEIDSMPTSLYRQLVTLRKTRRRWLQHQSWGFPAKPGLTARHMHPSTPISLANAIEQTLAASTGLLSPVRRPTNPFGQSASAVNLPQHPFGEQNSVFFPQEAPQQQQQQQQQQAGQAVFSGRVMSSGGVGVGIPPSFTQFGPTSTSNHQHSASGELFAGAASGNTSSNSGSSAATRSDVGRKRASWGGQR